MECITYKAGYKYQILEEYSVEIPIKPDSDIVTDYVTLSTAGIIIIKKGYAWDGPSGPTKDTPDFMRGSLVHDALYQLMRNGHLDKNTYRKFADSLLRDMCREDGMGRTWSRWVYISVRLWADPAADPASKKPVIKAPKRCQNL